MAKSPKSAPESLWWDPFVALFDELDRAPLSDNLPNHLVEKIKTNHRWFVESVSGFKPPNEASKKLVESDELLVGSHNLSIMAELRETALKVSQLVNLDEVQSYILVDRSVGPTSNAEYKELVHSVVLRYYVERQCLLKCIRRTFVHALYTTDTIGGEAMVLIKEDLQNKLISLVQDLLASAFSVKSDMKFTILWVEEMLIEANLIFDILFLAFYDNFTRCTLDQWKSLSSIFREMLGGSYDVSKMAVSIEAMTSFYHAKAQLLFILIETLDLENLLRMVHDEVPFREVSCAFSLTDIQEIDVEISMFSEELERESGPLVLAWAVHLCLVSSLLESDTNTLMDMDHISYVRQAFGCAPFDYLLEIICGNTFKESDGPVSGFVSIVRTLISAFIASYELSESTSDGYLSSILGILCNIYRREESLCTQFWDKESFVDGPIRSVLYMLEKEYPFQKLDFVRFLSAVCEGAWPAQCVYNYLEKMRGMTTLYQMPSGGGGVRSKDMVRLSSPMAVPGVESIVIPSGTCGFVVRAVDESLMLVHWEFPHSGVFLFLLNLAQGLHFNRHEESSHIMDLIYRMISANKEICFSLLSTDSLLMLSRAEANKLGRQLENDFRIDVVKLVCTSVLNLVQQGGDIGIVANSFGILAEMLKCMPSRVLDVALTSNIFSTEITGQPNGSWILSTGLARLFFAACEESDGDCSSLAISVLDFISQLVEKGVTEYSFVSPLIIFSLQYMFVNHTNWKYKKQSRWRTTLKVFELIKCCIRVLPPSHGLGRMVRDILLFDSAVLSVIWRIIIVLTEALDSQMSYPGHSSEIQDIEVVELVLGSALDVIHDILDELPEEKFASLPPLFSLLLSPTTKPMPFSSLVILLISFSHNPGIQMASARMLSSLSVVASKFHSQLFEYANLVFDATQMKKLKNFFCESLDDGLDQDDSIKVVVLDLLTSIASYQPALFSSLALESEPLEIKPTENDTIKRESKVVDMLLKYLGRSKYLINSTPHLLSSIVGLFKALWEGGTQYIEILDILKSSKIFWENLMCCLSPSHDKRPLPVGNLNRDDGREFSSRFSCQGAVLEIMANELFLEERILQGEISEKKSDKSIKHVLRKVFESHDTEEILKHCTVSEYDIDILHRAKAAVSLCVMHLIKKVSSGNTGSLSVSLVKRIGEIAHSLSEHPAFSKVLTGERDQTAVFSKIDDHLQGKLKGNNIPSGPFLDLCTCLLDANLFRCKAFHKDSNGACIYDVSQAAKEMGFDLWTLLSDWKGLVEVAEDMFMFMYKINSLVLVEDSKLSTLRAFIRALTVYKEYGGTTVPEAFVVLGIKYVCKSIQATLNSLISTTIINTEEESFIFRLLSTQAELLLTLVKIGKAPLNSISILTEVTSSGIKVLANVRRPGSALNKTIKLFLMLQLDLLVTSTNRDDASENTLTEVTSISGLLSPLCKYSKNPELSNLALVCMDLILKHNLVSSNIIVQNHLPIHDILQKIRNESISDSVSASVALSFFLTLSKGKGGVQFLHSAHILSFLNALLGEGDPFLTGSVHLWSLGVALITSLIHATGSDSIYSDIVEEAFLFLSEKASVMSYYLSAPELPINDKKRPRPNNSRTTLDALTLTKQCLFFVHTLSRYKVSGTINSGLMEKVIHLLAFISKRSSKLPFCPPSNKEEVKLDKCTAVTKIKHGWFGLPAEPTRFTETVALRIYEISLLVLSILCVQAEAAVKRAEELGFVDPANLPELPMPEILHALQDQAIAVVTEVLSVASKSKSLEMEVERVCVLLVQVLERSLYLELCVSYLCGVRPVLGRVEDFSREIKPMMYAMEHQKDFIAYRRSLNQIVALLYPELLHKGDLM
ncbi:Nucleoporin NUP188 [Rhynchospora pubera]|uniref:Nucleoporin NUP188 n=1 Tax=Rhynchospora pubera TaxID=906938 RepID=A0AAV8ENE4_9POAL|nr:Nucleoporin NUP188 [Rhynchospora pubera]